MDLERVIGRIRGGLNGSAPDVRRRLLQGLLDSVPVHETPSVLVAEDYVEIFRYLSFSALFPQTGYPIPAWNCGIAHRTMEWDGVFS